MWRGARRRDQVDASQGGLKLVLGRCFVRRCSAFAVRADCENQTDAVRVKPLSQPVRRQFSTVVLPVRPWILPDETLVSRFVPRGRRQFSIGVLLLRPWILPAETMLSRFVPDDRAAVLTRSPVEVLHVVQETS